jgi:DNA modification methylase
MNYELLQGDCIEVLKTLPAASVHCVVTSPPYFGLRDYLVGGQIGLEHTVGEYVQKLVDVFREVRRVLRDDGVCWLNLGDSYAGSWGNYGGQNRGNGSQREITNGSQAHQKAYDGLEAWRPPTANPGDGLKPKDLIGVPWRVAFALQADGWWLRSDIIWHKPNPMPESVTDRPTKAHEYLFLLTKAERYYYDAQAIAEPAQNWTGQAATFERTGPVSEHVLPGQSAAQHRPDRKPRTAGNKTHKYVTEYEDSDSEEHRTKAGLLKVADVPWTTRNRRSVWTVATLPFKEAHFATYPVALVKPCIMAGTSAHGCCSACGAPWVRVVEREVLPPPDRINNNGFEHDAMTTHGEGAATLRNIVERNTTGWEPSCTCGARVVPCTVLDPFNGSGTTGVAAIGLGREYIGIDLNPDYIKLAERRLNTTQPALLGV